MFTNKHLRRAFEIARAAVIAEPLPELHEGIVIAASEVGNAGQGIEEAEIVAAHDGGTRLLEHDLRDPDVIGRRLVAPRQISCVGGGLAPCEECFTEGGKDAVSCPW